MEVFFTPFALMFFLYFTVLIYGMAVMRSVVEEKNSKIFEVLLSSATSKQLMAGKVLGVGMVGLAQILIWAVAGMFFSGPAIAGAGKMLKFTPAQFAYFGLFFVLAFLLYSALFAAVGAMVNSDQEAQQLQTFVMLPLILCMVFITKVIADPNGAISFWASLFPLDVAPDHVRAHHCAEAAGVADRALDRDRRDQHLCTAGAVFAHLSRGHPDVWQASDVCRRS